MLLEFILSTSFIWIPAIVLGVYFVTKKDDEPAQNYSDQPVVNDRDQLWLTYLDSFRGTVKSKKEKELLEALLAGKPADTLYTEVTATVPTQAAPMYQQQAEELITPIPEQRQPIDNTILLLYFGAFLLVASVGLFVAIGGLDGVIRTLIVAITAAVLYVGGIWLYKTSTKLAQAGVSFAGTGMIVAPLTGVAWYNLVSDQMNGGFIWLITSVVCLGLFIHAYSTVKNDFIAYLLIGSFVSSLESSILATEMPTYVYAWGLVITALILAVVNQYRKTDDKLSNSSYVIAHLLIPASALGSLSLINEAGSTQLAVTLLMAGVYYGLLAAWNPQQRRILGSAAQTSVIAGILGLIFAINQSFSDLGVALTVITVLYATVIAYIPSKYRDMYNLTLVGSMIAGLAVILSLFDAPALVIALLSAILLSGSIWLRLHSNTALAVGGSIITAVPFIAGQYALSLNAASIDQLLYAVTSPLAMGLVVMISCTYAPYKQYYPTSSFLFMIGAVLAFIPASLNGFEAVTVITAILLGTCVLFRFAADDSNWLPSSGIVTFVPVLYALFVYGIDDISFSVAVGIALIWNIGVSLVTRQALVRWLVVLAMLLAPMAIGGGGIGLHWASAGYAGGYLLVVASCVLARAIARGKLLLSTKVAISSYYTEASQAYVAGYSIAGGLAVLISLNDDASQKITTLILCGLAMLLVVITKIEKDTTILAALPVFAQAALISGLRPDLSETASVGTTALLFTVTAIGTYIVALELKAQQSIRLVSIITTYAGVSLVFVGANPDTLLLPLSLLLAGIATCHYALHQQQAYRELSLVPVILAAHWALLIQGYDNIHIHTHVLAVFLIIFGIWRTQRGDVPSATTYLQAVFLVTTIPLAIQSLGGESGGMYGLILIVEQIGFMLAGVTFSQKFLLRWGLWTGLAAILFQLRGLGWAFLSLLAVIIIGIAIYRLQKHPIDNQ